MISDKNVRKPLTCIMEEQIKQYKSKKWNQKNINLVSVIKKILCIFLEAKIRKIFCRRMKDIASSSKSGSNFRISPDKEQKEKLYVFKILS
jgi:hypothetical protein